MAKIKAVIFDLDDTLFDCTGQLVEEARKNASKALAKILPLASEGEIHKKAVALYEEFGPNFNVFDRICSDFNAEDKEACVDIALRAYNSDEVKNISLFDDATETLEKLRSKGLKTVIISSGIYSRQQRKIELLNLKPLFDLILIHDIEKGGVSKEKQFRQALEEFSLKPEEVVSVGDRIKSEIRMSNKLGIISVRMLHGRFSKIRPKNDLEQPDFEISKLSELPKIIRKAARNQNGKPRVVAIGGGTGLPMVLSGLKEFTPNLAAIVTVTDSGRSSGMLRKDLHILPPGDIRNCLIALSDSEKLLLDLFQYRFEEGGLEGHSFGNLFIAALTKTTGSFEKAIKQVGKILAIKGKVLPSTLQDTHICAELEDGTVIEEEFNVRKLGKSPIKKVFLKHKVEPLEETLRAIGEADLIVLGPGSLFTSIMPNLLVKGIPTAISKSKAKKVYLANIMTQPGQTDGFSLSMHVAQIEKYLGKGVLDIVLVNAKQPSAELVEKYEKENASMVENDFCNLPKGIKVVEVDMLEKESKHILWNKQYLLRHDPQKLGNALIGLV